MPEHVLMSEVEVATDGGGQRRWPRATLRRRLRAWPLLLNVRGALLSIRSEVTVYPPVNDRTWLQRKRDLVPANRKGPNDRRVKIFRCAKIGAPNLRTVAAVAIAARAKGRFVPHSVSSREVLRTTTSPFFTKGAFRKENSYVESFRTGVCGAERHWGSWRNVACPAQYSSSAAHWRRACTTRTITSPASSIR